MLTSVVVTPDCSLADGLQRLAFDSRQVSVYKRFDHYPTGYELVRFLNVCDPDLLLLDLSNWKRAAQIAAEVKAQFPLTAIIGIGGSWLQLREEEFEAGGVTAILTTPLSLPGFQAGVMGAFRSIRCNVHDSLAAFLPAKAGNGSSVTAFNVAAGIGGNLKRKTVLIDSDLRSGVLAIRAGFSATFYLQDVLENPSMLSHTEWLRCVEHEHGMDILPAGRSSVGSAPKWSNYYHLLQYVDAEYESVVVDLPETITEDTAEVLLRANQIYVVCTPEQPSLELAQWRLDELGELGVVPDRVALLVNRWHPTDPPVERYAEELRCEVAKALPNDYQSLRRATDEGRPVDPLTELGSAYRSVARRIAGFPEEEPAAEEENKSKFRLATILGR